MTAFPNELLRIGPTNPILLRVVTAGGRRFRHALTRWIYLGLLIGVLLVALLATSSTGGARTLSDSAKASMQVFKYISYVQLAMICLLAPVFTAGAITQERDSRTYAILLATPLTNTQILVGSLFSRLFYVLALLLSGLPVFAITMFFGGVTGGDIATSFAIAASTALFTGSLAMTIAVFRLGSGKTVFWFYVLNAVYLVGLWFLDTSLAPRSDSIPGYTTWLTGIHPFLALESIVSPTVYQTPAQVSVAEYSSWLWPYLLNPALAYVTLTTSLSLFMILPSAIFLRRIAQRSDVSLGQLLRTLVPWIGATRRKARRVWNNPVAWREAATRASVSARGLTRWAVIVLGVAAGVALVWLNSQHGFLNSDDRGRLRANQNVQELLIANDQNTRLALLGGVVVVFSVALLVAANTAASAVTRERESQTLDLLLCTPITSRYYIWGKLRGLVSFMLPFAIVPAIMVLAMVLWDIFRLNRGGGDSLIWPETLVLLPVYITSILAWTCMLGLNLSLKFSRTIVAVMATVGVLLGICGLLGVCGFALARSAGGFGLFMAPFSPFTGIGVMIDPQHTAQSLGTNGDMVSSPLAARVMFAISTLIACTLYCVLTWTMYRSMVKNFDMIIRRQHQ